MELLTTRDVGIAFGGLQAVGHFDISLQENELVGLIGPNGAGKTTIFNLLTGVYQPTEGEIYFNGQKTNNKKPADIVALGMARTFQNIRLFKNLSVIDNIKIAFQKKLNYSALAAVLRLPVYWRQEKQIEVEALKLLVLLHMQEDADKLAKNLPYGKQRKLEICRALATGPKLLLLDEPAAGMNPQETQELMETIRLVRENFHLTILLIEHDMNLVMGICERLIVIDYGQIIAKGTPEEIKVNKQVIKAYLGS